MQHCLRGVYFSCCTLVRCCMCYYAFQNWSCSTSRTWDRRTHPQYPHWPPQISTAPCHQLPHLTHTSMTCSVGRCLHEVWLYRRSVASLGICSVHWVAEKQWIHFWLYPPALMYSYVENNVNLKLCKHIALHQIHKIKLFLASSYDPLNLCSKKARGSYGLGNTSGWVINHRICISDATLIHSFNPGL